MRIMESVKPLCILLSAFAIWFGPARVAEAQAPSRAVLEQVADYPSLIVYNAKIYTMDNNLSSHQAMAIRGNRIWRLGTNAEIRQLAGPQTELIDAKDRAVLPGLIDTHTHPHLWAVMHLAGKYDRQLQYLWVQGATVEEYKRNLAEAVKERIQQAGPDQWVLAAMPGSLIDRVFSPSPNEIPRPGDFARTGQGGITTADLDRIAPNTPFVVTGGILGGSVHNTKAKEMMMRALGREPNGLAMLYLVGYEIILKGKTKEVADMLAEEMQEWIPLGITSIESHVEVAQVLRSLNYLDQQGKMPIRWGWAHQMGLDLAKDPAEFYSLLGDFAGQGSDYLWNVGVPLSVGDVVACTSAVPRTAELREQKDRLAARACQQHPGARAYDAFVSAVRAGLRIGASSMASDRGLDTLFQTAEELIRNKVITLEEMKQKRWAFDIWANMVRPDQAALAARYGIWVNFGPLYMLDEEKVREAYGPEYVSWVAPVKAWQAAGARFALCSCSLHIPLGQSHDDQMADAMLYKGYRIFQFVPDNWRNTVWPHLGAWITRELNNKVHSPQNKLDRTTVMKGWTIWAAEYMSREKQLGSLEPGKLADLIVIDQDYFTIPETDINNIKTSMTVIGGKVKFKATNF